MVRISDKIKFQKGSHCSLFSFVIALFSSACITLSEAKRLWQSPYNVNSMNNDIILRETLFEGGGAI